MRRLLTVSALFALAMIAVTAVGQEPASSVYRERVVVESDYPFPFQFTRAQPPKTEDGKGDKKTEKKADPTDAAIAAALANDPDVRMAKAKIQLAEAELAKARHAITLKVMTLKGAIEQHKATVGAAQERVAWTERLVKGGQATQTQLLDDRIALEKAKMALATAEAELKLLTGGATGATGATGDPTHAQTVVEALKWLGAHNRDADSLLAAIAAAELLRERQTMKGPIPDRIRAALDKPVKLGAKGERVMFEKALEVFKKEAGFDVPVRGPVYQIDTITSEGEELSVGAWFQLFEDHSTIPRDDLKLPNHKGRFYVREYGILLAPTDSAPPDAPTLTAFWKQKPPAPKTEADPQSKPK